MRAAPRVASSSRLERDACAPVRARHDSSVAKRSAGDVLGVLHTPAQFAAVAAARGTHARRGARRWLAMTAVIVDSSADAGRPRLRWGLIVPKRLARRAIDRNLVKRVAREALRVAAPTLIAAAAPHGVDVVLRLKAPLTPRAQLARVQLKKQLRREADALLAALAHDVLAC